MHSNPDAPSDQTPFLSDDLVHEGSIIFYTCSLDEDFPIVRISNNIEQILGYTPDEVCSDATFWLKRIHPEDRPRIENSFRNILEQQKRTYIYRIRHAGGHYLWMRDENMVSYDEEGKPVAISGTAIDITRQKQIEQELSTLNENLEHRIRERTHNLTAANRKLKKQIQHRNKVEKQILRQKKKLRLLQAGINYIHDMVIISKAPEDDPLNSKIVYVNKAFESFTGYSAAEVMGKNPSFLHGEETGEEELQQLNTAIRNHQHARIQFINYKKDGSPYWVDLEMSPFPAEEQGAQYWVGINRDITQRKQAERALEEKEEKYRSYTELSFDAIFEFSLKGIIIGCNSRACQLFGYDRDELLGMNIRDLVPEKYQAAHPEAMNSSLTTGSKVVQREYKRKDGSIFPAEISTKLYHRSEEDHIVAYVRDISDQTQYQDALERSLREKDTLLAEVHHRVKNNLAVISGLLEMQSFNARNEEIVSELRESQARIQSIATVHEMLYQSESFSDIGLASYIDELVSYISGTFGHEGADIRFEKDMEPLSLTVKQAVPCGLLLNELITNAYKHAFPGRDKGTIFISLHSRQGRVHMEVRDDGVGLPDDFDISRSSTLGITLVNTLVRQLEGTLAVSGSPQTCFSISFEVAD